MLLERANASVESDGVLAGVESLKMMSTFLYSNVVNNFFENLNAENIEEYQLKEEESSEIKTKYNWLFEKAIKSLEFTEDKDSLTQEDYIKFREELKNGYPSIYNFLLEFEKFAQLTSCEEKIRIFVESLKSMGPPPFSLKIQFG